MALNKNSSPDWWHVIKKRRRKFTNTDQEGFMKYPLEDLGGYTYRTRSAYPIGATQYLIILPLFLIIQLTVFGNCCNINACTSTFRARKSSLPSDIDMTQTGSQQRAYCLYLQEYERCVNDLPKSCFGDIAFHSAISAVKLLVKKHAKCSEILSHYDGHEDLNLTTLDANRLQSQSELCRLAEDSDYNLSHCGMFGDPHLKTFNSSFMTCLVRGAWPLLSTSHLAIQVTNEPVSSSSIATAISKVTVLIKGLETCGLNAKTYEASSDNLPKAFVDGTSWVGVEASKASVSVTEVSPGSHVLIQLKHINASVDVRRIGRYLSVFVTLPQLLLASSIRKEDFQLCQEGCPLSEQLIQSPPSAVSVPSITEGKAISLCSEYKVTDYYLDACVFDLVTTGDESFRESSSSAQKDLLKRDPSYLLDNCRHWPCRWNFNGAISLSLDSAIGILMVLLFFLRI